MLASKLKLRLTWLGSRHRSLNRKKTTLNPGIEFSDGEVWS